MPGWIRASEMDRNLVCNGPVALVALGAVREEDKGGEAANWGTSVHHWKETGKVVPGREWPNHAPLLKKKLIQYDRHEMWPDAGGGTHEVAFARNTSTSVVESISKGTKLHKETWKSDHDDDWETGTCDYIARSPGLWVDDLKTGKTPPDPAKSLQLRWYALSLCQLSGTKLTSVRASITHMPRYPVDCKVDRYEVVFSVNDLKDMMELLSVAHKRYRSREKYLKTGDHCSFCPVISSCDAGTEAITRLKKEWKDRMIASRKGKEK